MRAQAFGAASRVCIACVSRAVYVFSSNDAWPLTSGQRRGRNSPAVPLGSAFSRAEVLMAKITKTLIGESLVGEGNEVAHIDLIVGPRGSTAESAFVNALTNNKDGFTSLLAVVSPNLLAKPNTILFNKVTIKDARQAVQMFGPAQYGVAKAVVDCVADGTIPEDEADDLFISVGVFIHWEAADDAKIQQYNYEATKEALKRAVAGEPKAKDVVAQAASAKHPFAANA
jgi:5,6,7,8-tetrahydromethanopterin hydro-lyase